MPVPTVADVDGDGVLEIVVSLKDGVDKVRQVLVYKVPGSGTKCLPWPTGRGNLWQHQGVLRSRSAHDECATEGGGSGDAEDLWVQPLAPA